MKMTSSQAAKLLRQLNDELKTLVLNENNTKSFIAAISEDEESVRPEYNYSEMQEKQKAIELKIRKLKHTINVFNTTTVIPEFNITIDEMLVYLPQLSQKVIKLSDMKDSLPKVRENRGYSHSSQIIDYRYANYSIEEAKKDYTEAYEELLKAQIALDYINNTAEFDVNI